MKMVNVNEQDLDYSTVDLNHIIGYDKHITVASAIDKFLRNDGLSGDACQFLEKHFGYKYNKDDGGREMGTGDRLLNRAI